MDKKQRNKTANDSSAMRFAGIYLIEVESAKQSAEILNIADFKEMETYKEAQLRLEQLKNVAKEGDLSYSVALFLLKQGFKVSRAKWGWKGTNVYIQTQFPDEHSKMTEPYTYMVKRLFDDDKNKIGELVFPCVISDESVYANDWFLVEE